MIIVSSRKFRDSQNEFFELALEEEVILKTLHYGNFRLVPIREEKKKRGRKPKSVKDQKGVIVIPTPTIQTENIEIAPVQVTIETQPEEIIDIKNESPTVVVESENIPVQEENTNVNEQEETILEGNIIEDKTQEEIVKEPEAQVQVEEEIPHITVIEDTVQASQPQNPQERDENTPYVDQSWKPGRVFVDPSLLSLEEVRIQEGLDDDTKKKGFLSKLFGKKK